MKPNSFYIEDVNTSNGIVWEIRSRQDDAVYAVFYNKTLANLSLKAANHMM